jgi:uncharacterized membrane protein HdeD (DUF308 family)
VGLGCGLTAGGLLLLLGLLFVIHPALGLILLVVLGGSFLLAEGLWRLSGPR